VARWTNHSELPESDQSHCTFQRVDRVSGFTDLVGRLAEQAEHLEVVGRELAGGAQQVEGVGEELRAQVGSPFDVATLVRARHRFARLGDEAVDGEAVRIDRALPDVGCLRRGRSSLTSARRPGVGKPGH
jgi:hypothetical protein